MSRPEWKAILAMTLMAWGSHAAGCILIFGGMEHLSGNIPYAILHFVTAAIVTGVFAAIQTGYLRIETKEDYWERYTYSLYRDWPDQNDAENLRREIRKMALTADTD